MTQAQKIDHHLTKFSPTLLHHPQQKIKLYCKKSSDLKTFIDETFLLTAESAKEYLTAAW